MILVIYGNGNEYWIMWFLYGNVIGLGKCVWDVSGVCRFDVLFDVRFGKFGGV